MKSIESSIRDALRVPDTCPSARAPFGPYSRNPAPWCKGLGSVVAYREAKLAAGTARLSDSHLQMTRRMRRAQACSSPRVMG